MTKEKIPDDSSIILYVSKDGQIKVDVRFQDETVWLSQKRLAELFNVEINTVNYHLKEIFKSGELVEDSVIRKIRITANDGKKYLTAFYNEAKKLRHKSADTNVIFLEGL